jgi:hypothetical protein
MGWFEISDRSPRRSYRGFLAGPSQETTTLRYVQGMMRPAGRVPAGTLVLFTRPMRLHKIHCSTIPCLRTFSSSPIPGSAMSGIQRKKLIKDAKRGKPMKITRLVDIPEDVGYLGMFHDFVVRNSGADWRRIDDSAYEQRIAECTENVVSSGAVVGSGDDIPSIVSSK